MSKALIISVLMLAGLPQARTAEPVVAPDWTLEMADGSSVNLDDAASQRVTILFFWATWCPYCKALMPHLQSLKLEYPDTVQVLAINIFEDGDPVAFIEDAGYEFTLLLSGDAVADRYGVTATPGVFILDSNRTLHFDLRSLPRIVSSDHGDSASNQRKAALRAPYWAAAIRKNVDELLQNTEAYHSSRADAEQARKSL